MNQFGRLLQTIAPISFIIVCVIFYLSGAELFIFPILIWFFIMFYTIREHGKSKFFNIIKGNIAFVVLFILILLIIEHIIPALIDFIL